MAKKDSFGKFNDSLAGSMAIPMTYTPIFCLMPLLRGKGVWVFVACIILFVFSILEAYLLYILIGDVSRKAVDQDRLVKAFSCLFVISLLFLAGYMFFFEEAALLWQVLAWLLMVIILFIATYSVCKQYILKKEA